MADLKRSEVLSFVDGTLTIKASGHAVNGWGVLVFDEEQIEIKPHEEKDGGYVEIEIMRSELRALRDFLNRVLPPSNNFNGLVAALEGMLKLFGRPLPGEYVDGGASYRLAVETVEAARYALAKAAGP